MMDRTDERRHERGYERRDDRRDEGRYGYEGLEFERQGRYGQDFSQDQRWGQDQRWENERYQNRGDQYGRRTYGWESGPYGREYNLSRGVNSGREFENERGFRGSGRPEFGNYGSNYGNYGGYGGPQFSGGMGEYAGRGPKGYKRSDERIKEDVCERLTVHADVDATEIEVKVNNGEVTLTGSVSDRRSKRAAEDAVHEVAGVLDVHNQLRVEAQSGSRMEAQGAMTSAASGKTSKSA